MLGLEAQDNYEENLALVDFANAAGNLYIPNSDHRMGVYAQDEWRLLSTLAATLGLRVDSNDVTSTNLSPRAGLVWQVAPPTTAKLLYGVAHRAPNAFEDSSLGPELALMVAVQIAERRDTDCPPSTVRTPSPTTLTSAGDSVAPHFAI
jgi:hypothetical protein